MLKTLKFRPTFTKAVSSLGKTSQSVIGSTRAVFIVFSARENLEEMFWVIVTLAAGMIPIVCWR